MVCTCGYERAKKAGVEHKAKEWAWAKVTQLTAAGRAKRGREGGAMANVKIGKARNRRGGPWWRWWV